MQCKQKLLILIAADIRAREDGMNSFDKSRMANKMRGGKEILLALFFIIFGASCPVWAELQNELANCARIEDNEARLTCFDAVVRQNAGIALQMQATSPDSPVLRESVTAPAQLSVLQKLWDLEPRQRKHSFVLSPYRPTYFLPAAYNSSPNESTDLEFDPRAKAKHNEAKFQISFKAKVWEDVFQNQLQDFYDKSGVIQGLDVWITYTQLSFWQLYNSAFSAPFRDTNYEPEVLLNLRTNYEILGLQGRYFNIGLNHQSNGRANPLSRSWNRLVANVGLERKNFNLQIKAWHRFAENEANDDNPDLTRYMGYGELWAAFYWKDMRFAAMLRNNLRRENLGAVQLDWSVPPSSLGKLLLKDVLSPAMLNKYLADKISLYVQYFNGYGEGLLDYNHSVNRISVGFMIADWN